MLRYAGNNGTCQNSMSVRFNSAGTHILALRRRLAPVLYAVHSPDPVAEFYHQDYYNSCTMKSCSFAGEGDQFVLSGSDDFNLYMWKIPEGGGDGYGESLCKYLKKEVDGKPLVIVLHHYMFSMVNIMVFTN